MSESKTASAYRHPLPELEFVRYRVEDRIAYIMLDRPDKLNAMSDKVVGEVRLAFQHFDLDPDAFVAIVHGAGRAFTSGADVRQRQLRPREELESFGLWSPETRRRDLFFDFVNWKPIIAAAHGYVMGMGVGLCLSCDLVIAAASTQFQVTEVGRGLHGSTLWALLRYRGAGAFADEIGLTGRMFTGEEAAQRGIITRATPDGQHMSVAEDFARQILKNPPLAVRAGVRSRRLYLLENQRLSFILTEHSPALHLTRDFHEAAKAFVDKRPPPRFEGR
ncbi:MAG: enoyl-CoA hydratase/isomerase family protein [Burkholderiales bacterium]|nr:enoyl-CoA hydratase/isomerase family protein [Burkholderiales bacterium]